MKTFVFYFIYIIISCVYFTFVTSLTQVASSITLTLAIILFLSYIIASYYIFKKYGKKFN